MNNELDFLNVSLCVFMLSLTPGWMVGWVVIIIVIIPRDMHGRISSHPAFFFFFFFFFSFLRTMYPEGKPELLSSRDFVMIDTESSVKTWGKDRKIGGTGRRRQGRQQIRVWNHGRRIFIVRCVMCLFLLLLLLLSLAVAILPCYL